MRLMTLYVLYTHLLSKYAYCILMTEISLPGNMLVEPIRGLCLMCDLRSTVAGVFSPLFWCECVPSKSGKQLKELNKCWFQTCDVVIVFPLLQKA